MYGLEDDYFLFGEGVLSANGYIIGGLGWWFGFLGSPHERDCYFGVALESQTTGHQTTHLPLVDFGRSYVSVRGSGSLLR